MNTRTILLAVVGVAAAGAAAWHFGLLDMLDPPPPAKPPVAALKPPPVAAAPTPPAASPSPAASPAPTDVAGMDRAIKATQSRVGELEKEVADLRRQVEMKDKAIAAMEKKGK